MDATRTPTAPDRGDPEAVDALALVRRIRDDFAARTAGLTPDELTAPIRREAGALRPEPPGAEARRAAA